jgi:hypothetical protein
MSQTVPGDGAVDEAAPDDDRGISLTPKNGVVLNVNASINSHVAVSSS